MDNNPLNNPTPTPTPMPEPAPAPVPVPTPAPAPQPAPVVNPTPLTEAAPTATNGATGTAAPIVSPADPNAPVADVPTTIGDDHVPQNTANKKKFRKIIIVAAVVAVIITGGALFYFLSFKTLRCEGTISQNNIDFTEEVIATFRFNQVDSITLKQTVVSHNQKFSDSDIESLRQRMEKDDDIDHLEVKKEGDNKVVIEASASRDYLSEEGESYDNVKKYLEKDLDLTCK